MCCATFIHRDMTFATTFVRYDVCWPEINGQPTAHRPLRMNWAVVSDEHGNRRLQMVWRVDGNEP